MADQNRSRKRSHVIDADGIKEILWQEPTDYRVAFEALRDMVLPTAGDITKKRKKLAASSLDDMDVVLELFGLVYGGISKWDLDQYYAVPEYLTECLRRTHEVTGFSTQNEAIARVVIDQILLSAISEENDAALQGLQVIRNDERQSKDGPTPLTLLRAGQNQSEPAQLSLEFETALSAPVMHDGEEKILGGFADYTLFYKRRVLHAEATTLSANLVVVEAKRKNTTDSTTAQLITYMAIIHKSRLSESKHNAVVFGFASDGRTFRFLRIDNDSVVTKSRLLEWEEGNSDKQAIYSIMRQVIHIAKLSSPSTSPLKDPDHRKVVLKGFGCLDRAQNFDFWLNNLVVREAESDDEIEDLGGFSDI